MDDDTDFDQAVDDAVQQAQKLDQWKQTILQEMRDRGEDTDGVRIIVGHRVGGEWTATEIQGYPD